MTRPLILTNLLEGRRLPEVDGGYLVQKYEMIPYVWVPAPLRRRLVIPVKWTEVLVDLRYGHTVKVITADESLAVDDTHGFQDVLHTLATMPVLDVIHVPEQFRIRVTRRELWTEPHTSTLISGMIGYPGGIHMKLIECCGVGMFAEVGRYIRGDANLETSRVDIIPFSAVNEVRASVVGVDIPPTRGVVEFGIRRAQCLHVGIRVIV